MQAKSLSLIILFSFFLCKNCFGQSFQKFIKEKSKHGLGFELDHSQYPFLVLNSRAEGLNYWKGYDFHFSYFFKINTLELNENNSINISTYPSIGFGYYLNTSKTTGIGSLNIPIELGYTWGAGSTNQTKEDVGLTFGFGREIRFLPLLLLKKNPDAQFVKKEKNVGVNIKAGFIFNKKNYLEIYGKFTYFPSKNIRLDGNIDLNYIPVYSCSLGLMIDFK